MAKTVVGLFDDRSHAQMALQDLENAGLRENTTFMQQPETGVEERLVSAGIPQQDADIYAQGVQQGGALLVVQGIADDDAEEAAAILDQHHIVDISSRSANYQRMSLDRTASTTTSMNTGASTRSMNANLYNGQDTIVPIIEEELRVGKRQVERGGVRVRTRVIETPVNEQVTLRDEHVEVQRRPVDRPVSEADLAAFQEGVIEVRETDEEAIVDKQAHIVEEVAIRKDVQERTETIQDTVRRTDVDVEEVGGTTRTTGYTETSGTTGYTGTTGTTDEGIIERGAEGLQSGAERLTGRDLNNSGSAGDRDTRNNY